MSLNGDYQDDNIFAKILRGEIPSYKVFEDDIALGFMDAFPVRTTISVRSERERSLPTSSSPSMSGSRRSTSAMASWGRS